MPAKLKISIINFVKWKRLKDVEGLIFRTLISFLFKQILSSSTVSKVTCTLSLRQINLSDCLKMVASYIQVGEYGTFVVEYKMDFYINLI